MTVEEKARKIVKDMTVPCEDGIINLRVGAIIMMNTVMKILCRKKRTSW
jgi:hypothetical protein